VYQRVYLILEHAVDVPTTSGKKIATSKTLQGCWILECFLWGIMAQAIVIDFQQTVPVF
jgi:hypothetical protein